MRSFARHTTRLLLAAVTAVGAVSVGGTPAQADDPTPQLTAAQEIIDQLSAIAWPEQAAYNRYKTDTDTTAVTWGTPGSPTTYLNVSQCAPFLSAVLKRALGVNSSWLQARFGYHSPYSSSYYDKFLLDLQSTSTPPAVDKLPNFETRTTLSQVEPGDILAIKYTDQSTSTGHTGIVVETALMQKDSDVELEYAIKLADSTSNPHGLSLHGGDRADSRTTASGEYTGAGYGWIVVDPTSNDTPQGYWWGADEGLYRSDAIRPMLFSKLIA